MSLKPHQAASADASEGVEIRSDVFISTFEESGSINSLPEHDYNDDVASSSNKKGNTSMVKVLMSTTVAAAVLAAVGVTAYQMGVNQSASKMSTSMMSTTMTKSGKATGSPAPAPSGKAGKKYEFLNDVVAAGSPNPIGADGKQGPQACDWKELCCDDSSLCYWPNGGYLMGLFNATIQGCIDYFECLQDPASGPVVVGDWWLQRDVKNGEMFFEEDAVCGRISVADDNSGTRFELWNDVHLGMPLGFFKEFSVGYDYRALGGDNGGYLSMSLRVADNTEYYDCRFDYLLDNAVATGTLVITPETEGTAVGGSSCGGATTLQAFLAANPNAVMGVGNGELYTFVLNTGSTGQNNQNLLICWSDVSIKHVDEAGNIHANTFEFTTLV